VFLQDIYSHIIQGKHSGNSENHPCGRRPIRQNFAAALHDGFQSLLLTD